MKKKIVEAFDKLMLLTERHSNSQYQLYWMEKNDSSRSIKESTVIVAFEICQTHSKCFTYSLDTETVSVDNQHIYGSGETYLHSHNFLEIAYVIDRPLKLIINDTITEIQPGEICIMDYSTLHAEKLDDEPVKILYFSIVPELFDEIVNPKKTSSFEQEYLRELIHKKRSTYQYVHFIPDSDAKKSSDSILATLNESIERAPGSSEIIRGHVIRLLNLLTTEYTTRLSSAEKTQARRALYYDICSYIKEHCRDITISDLSEHFHYNTYFFNRLIKEFSGLTYVEYLQAERLSRAENLLLETKLSVAAISDSVGYQNTGYFYKIFREKHGMLPSEYRQSNQQKKNS